MFVGAVVMYGENVIPLIAILTALKEMLCPIHRNIAHLIDGDVRWKRQQHMRGETELGRSAPCLGPSLDDVGLLILRQHRVIGQGIGHG